MLPDPQNTPPALTEISIHLSIAFAVALQFAFPVSAVARRHGAMLRAPVPKAAIHEYCQPRHAEDKIGTPRNRLTSPPSGKAVLPEDSNHCQLSFKISL